MESGLDSEDEWNEVAWDILTHKSRRRRRREAAAKKAVAAQRVTRRERKKRKVEEAKRQPRNEEEANGKLARWRLSAILPMKSSVSDRQCSPDRGPEREWTVQCSQATGDTQHWLTCSRVVST